MNIHQTKDLVSYTLQEYTMGLAYENSNAFGCL